MTINNAFELFIGLIKTFFSVYDC